MILEFDSVEKSFPGRRLLASIYMRCETGRITGLLGRNGSGKTTLMKIIFGTLEAEHKSVRINGRPLLSSALKYRAIAYLPQRDLLVPSMTLREAFRLSGIPTGDAIAAFPGLSELLEFTSEEMSFGWRRMAECFLVLGGPQPFCFLDEPFSGLAPMHIEQLQAVLNKVKLSKGILISDHLHRHVKDVSDELYVLANGATYRAHSVEDLIRFGYLPDHYSP
jgi:ABC-type multidrug transport system ATPase subunit